MHARNFLDEYFGHDGRSRKVLPEGKYAVKRDQFDQEDYNAIVQELKELALAERDLANVAETGAPAIGDTFSALLKANPKLKDPNNMRPSYLVNHVVMEEAMGLNEYEELRVHTTGDVVQAAMGCVAMEPTLEVLFDKVKEEQELANELEQQMAQMEGLSDDLESADEMIQQAMGQGNQGEAEDFQKQKEKIQEALKKLREQAEQTAEKMDQGLMDKLPEIKEQAKEALDQAKENAEDMDALSSTWGLDPGMLQKMPPARRLELAKRMNNDKFRLVAQLLGPLVRLAMGEQKKKVINSRDEIYDVEPGNDLSRTLPTEMLGLNIPVMRMLFMKKFAERQLLQYKMRGTEKIAQGGIIWCEDGSGSMGGQSEIFAKACGITLQQIAHKQKRDFFGIHFGGPGEYASFDFDLDGSVTFEYHEDREQFDKIEGLLHFAELFFGGGTDFMTPLSVALDILREQYEKDGEVKGDIVFCTDGMCGVDDAWMEEFKAEQERLGFRVWGIVIGGLPTTEPLNAICDGRVFTLTDLLEGGNALRDMFRNI
jgi:uncharacterized protein with von Willebrand factor type A (vWA) domain